MGVQGVPFFIFNNQVGVSGAHEPETLLQAMEQSLQPPAETANA
jgi:predicted DsbA family dithiol-disulfide isomerase